MNTEHLGSYGVIYQLRKDGFMLNRIEKRPLAVSDGYMDIGVWDIRPGFGEFTGTGSG